MNQREIPSSYVSRYLPDAYFFDCFRVQVNDIHPSAMAMYLGCI